MVTAAKLPTLSLASLLLTLPAAAQPVAFEPPAVVEINVTDAAKEHMPLLREIAAVYRQDNITDTCIRYGDDIFNNQYRDEITLAIGSGTDAYIRVKSLTVVSRDGMVRGQTAVIPEMFAEMPLNVDLVTTVRPADSTTEFPTPHFALRRAETDEDIIYAFSYLTSTDLRIEAVNPEFLDEEGESWILVESAGQAGREKVFVDPGTKFIHRIEFQEVGLNGEDFATPQYFEFSPQVHDSTPELVLTEIDGRFKVGSMAELVSKPIVVGDPAPQLTLYDRHGSEAPIPIREGEVTVVVFWSLVASNPFEKDLALIDEIGRWAKEENKPVNLIAVNVFDEEARDERLKNVEAFWKTHKYDMDTLVDLDDAAKYRYGVGWIPHSYVIDTQGVIRKDFRGPDPRIVAKMKAVIEDLL